VHHASSGASTPIDTLRAEIRFESAAGQIVYAELLIHFMMSEWRRGRRSAMKESS
jgi:hypothetical protein